MFRYMLTPLVLVLQARFLFVAGYVFPLCECPCIGTASFVRTARALDTSPKLRGLAIMLPFSPLSPCSTLSPLLRVVRLQVVAAYGNSLRSPCLCVATSVWLPHTRVCPQRQQSPNPIHLLSAEPSWPNKIYKFSA